MQVGVISDIHGNYQALRAVWSALERHGLTNGPVLNAGDNVGYGAAPEECVRFLREHTMIVCVQGNYDRSVGRFSQKQKELEKKWRTSRPEKYDAIRYDAEVLTESDRDWLLELPRERVLTLGECKVLLTHYAPGSKEGLGTWTSDERLRQLAGNTEAQIVVCGHTHTPFVRHAGGILWVNPGTVGRGWHSRRAHYAVLTLEPEMPPAAHLHQVLIP